MDWYLTPDLDGTRPEEEVHHWAEHWSKINSCTWYKNTANCGEELYFKVYIYSFALADESTFSKCPFMYKNRHYLHPLDALSSFIYILTARALSVIWFIRLAFHNVPNSWPSWPVVLTDFEKGLNISDDHWKMAWSCSAFVSPHSSDTVFKPRLHYSTQRHSRKTDLHCECYWLKDIA